LTGRAGRLPCDAMDTEREETRDVLVEKLSEAPKAPWQVREMVDPFITKSSFDLKAFCEQLPNKVITL
jgi:hypothetical protein